MALPKVMVPKRNYLDARGGEQPGRPAPQPDKNWPDKNGPDKNGPDKTSAGAETTSS